MIERREEIQEEFLCPITQAVMEDPVVIDTGRSFERSAILEWFGRGRVTDPMTNEELASTRVVPNVNLRNLIRRIPEDIARNQRRQARDFDKVMKLLEEAWGPAIQEKTPKPPQKLSNVREQELLDKIRGLEREIEALKSRIPQ